MNSNNLIDVKKIPQLLQQNYQFIDLRNSNDYKREHLQKFINIPYDSFFEALPSLDKSKPIVLVCYSGARSMQLVKTLNQQGYHSYSISGGFYAITTPTNNTYY